MSTRINSSINVNKTSDTKVSLRTPTCPLSTYLHIFGKRELKPDHEIEKSIRYFDYHFLLLPQPFQFFFFLTESIIQVKSLPNGEICFRLV